MKLSEALEKLRTAGPDELIRMAAGVDVDAGFRARVLDRESATKRGEKICLYRPVPPGDAQDGWPLGFTVRTETGSERERVALLCRAVVRLTDPQPVIDAYPQDEDAWGVEDLERLVGSLLAPELTREALAGRFAGMEPGPLPGSYAAFLLGKLDVILLRAGVEVVDFSISLDRLTGPVAAGEAQDQEPLPPLAFSRTSRPGDRDAAVRLSVLGSHARSGGFVPPRLPFRRSSGGSGAVDQVRRIRELIASEVQTSARIVRHWSCTGDPALTRDALELCRMLDSAEVNLRTLVPELAPGRRPGKAEWREWFESYEKDFALACRTRQALEEIQEAFLSGQIDGNAVRGQIPALNSLIDRLNRSLVKCGR